MYGCKSAWPLFTWLDDIGQTDIEVDLGHVLTLSTPGIHLVGRRQHVDIGGFHVSIWPMLTYLQRDVGSVWYENAQLQSPDRVHPVNGIYAVKVYSTLIHVIKGLATANFTTLPDKVEAAGRRCSQVAQLLQQLKFRDYSGVSNLSVEVSMKLMGTLARPSFAAESALSFPGMPT